MFDKAQEKGSRFYALPYCNIFEIWSIVHGLLGMVGGIIIIIVFTLSSIIHCLYWLVKLEKYKVKN